MELTEEEKAEARKRAGAVPASRTPQDAGTQQEADRQTRNPSTTQLIQFLII